MSQRAQSGTPAENTPDFPCCIGCRFHDCNQTKRMCEEIKKMILEKLDVKIVDKVPDPPAAVNLFDEVTVGEDMVINYAYTEMGRQMIILDIGAPVSITGVPWMELYLEEFGLRIDDTKSVKCHQPFVFGPSRRYISTTWIELPVLDTRLDR